MSATNVLSTVTIDNVSANVMTNVSSPLSSLTENFAGLQSTLFMIFAILSVMLVVAIINTSTRVKDNSWVKTLLSLGLAAVAIALFIKLKGLLLYVIIGFVFSYLLDPIVTFAQRKGIARFVSTIVLTVVIAGALVVAVLSVAPTMANILNEEFKPEIEFKVGEKVTTPEGKGKIVGTSQAYDVVYYEVEIDESGERINDFIKRDLEKEGQFDFLGYFPNPKYPGLSWTEIKINKIFEQLKSEELLNIGEMVTKLEEESRMKGKPTMEDSLHAAAREKFSYSQVKSYLENSAKGFGSKVSVIVVIPLLIFFFLVDGHKFMRAFIEIIPNKYFEMVRILLYDVENAFGNYIKGTFLDCSIIGALNGLVLMIIYSVAWGPEQGIPIGIGVGIASGILNAVPFLGAIIVTMVAGAPALINLNLVVFVLAIATPFIMNQIDNVLVYPLTVGSSVELHPLIVILALIAGDMIGGFAGMLVAIPSVAISRVFVTSLYKQLKGFDFI